MFSIKLHIKAIPRPLPPRDPLASLTINRFELIKAGSKGQQGKIYKDSWLLSTKEKNIRFGNHKIDSLAEKLSIPKYVKTEAKTIFKTAMDKAT